MPSPGVEPLPISARCYSPDLKRQPYWWEGISWDAPVSESLPEMVDAVVVGAGYTGLSAALTLSRAGRSVLVLEAGLLNTGASTRNGGQVSGQVKLGLGALIKRLGLEQAVAIYDEGRRSVDFLERLVQDETIVCDFARVGRLQPAFTNRDYEGLQREADLLSRHLLIETQLIHHGELHREIGSDYYKGALLRRDMAAVQPALLHKGLLDKVCEIGVMVAERSPVLSIRGESKVFEVLTDRQKVCAREVIVATNGYTGGVIPWLRRRIIPIPSQIVATEPISQKVMDELIPNRRIVVDTCRLHHYFRASPDGTRILLGGRAGANQANHLYQDLIRIFPQLHGTKVSHTWAGLTGYTFDSLPHLGVHEGVYYALGLCGGGVAWGPYLGHKIALQVLGSAKSRTHFLDQKLKTRPLYYGKPWFLPAMLTYYRLRDRFGA